MPSLSRPLSRPLSRLLAAGVLGGFDPLSLSPYAAFDPYVSGGQPLKTGGTAAGYLEGISAFPNLGSGSDAAQATSASQPIYLPHAGRNYLHLPGITGNTISVPMSAGTYDYLVTYIDDTTATGTVSESGGVVTIGPTGANFVNKQIWKIRLSQSGTPLAEFLADGATHQGTTYTDGYSKLWTVGRSGNNPASLIGHPVVRFDGVDDFLAGTFASAISGGRMFAAFSVLGNGGEANGRILATGVASDTTSNGFIFSVRNTGNLETYFSSSFRTSHSSGYAGRLLHESWTTGASIKSRRNNTDEQTFVVDTSTIASTGFTVAGRLGDGNVNPAIDLEALYLFPPTITDAQAAKVANHLNSRLAIY